MAEVVQEAPQEFWRSPLVLEAPAVAAPPAAAPAFADACADCGTEFMIGSRFCHACGLRRPTAHASTESALVNGLLLRSVARAGTGLRSSMRLVAAAWQEISFPDWLHYLHFHEIKRWIGLPTASLIAFMIGLGCVVGAIGVSVFFRASNLAEFQAIQMWRIEWLLAATASFVAGILLKKPSDTE